MAETLLSVGLDVGTTSTQLILSRLTVENRASGFRVPQMEITDRKILYESPVHFTPLQSEQRVDGRALRQLVLSEYQKAGVTPAQIHTGAVIITGETSRKENAAEVLENLSELSGDFVVATAGPELESVLAAKGSGAVDYARDTAKTVLHIDIGGGTSNMALIHRGKITQTGCLNVGGRLIKCDETGKITYISPVLAGLTSLSVGQTVTESDLRPVCELLCRALEMAAGRRPATDLLQALTTREVKQPWNIPQEPVTISLSGGVADCVHREHPPLAYGDLGVILGSTIRESLLCRDGYVPAKQTIRATVIGAGCHSTDLSGSTVYCRNVTLPKKNIPVIPVEKEDTPQRITQKLCAAEGEVILAVEKEMKTYRELTDLAETLAQGVGEKPLYVCLQQDMAKALGQKLGLMLPADRPILCLDGLTLTPESYLDVGLPVGPCYPVVIKTRV